jgi:hypothetical protein
LKVREAGEPPSIHLVSRLCSLHLGHSCASYPLQVRDLACVNHASVVTPRRIMVGNRCIAFRRSGPAAMAGRLVSTTKPRRAGPRGATRSDIFGQFQPRRFSAA